MPPDQSDPAEQALIRHFNGLTQTTTGRPWLTGPHWREVEAENLSRLLSAFGQAGIAGAEIDALLFVELPFFGAARLVSSRNAMNACQPGDSYPGFALWHHTRALAFALNRTNAPVYDAVTEFGLQQDLPLLMDYVRFFFDTVVGTMGKFAIVETLADLPWLAEATRDDKADVFGLLQPLQAIDTSHPNIIDFGATLLFKDALFRSKIRLALNDVPGNDDHDDLHQGQLYLFDEALLLEDLKVHQIIRRPDPN
jgi:hypothetical protein